MRFSEPNHSIVPHFTLTRDLDPSQFLFANAKRVLKPIEVDAKEGEITANKKPFDAVVNIFFDLALFLYPSGIRLCLRFI